MKIVLLRNNSSDKSPEGILQAAFAVEPVSDIVLEGLRDTHAPHQQGRGNVLLALPEIWPVNSPPLKVSILPYQKNLPISPALLQAHKDDTWLTISDGRFVTEIDRQWLQRILPDLDADVISVQVNSGLGAFQEKVRLTSQGEVAGLRRLYTDSAQQVPFSSVWPQLIFIKIKVLAQLLVDGDLPLAFTEFLARCDTNSLTRSGLEIAGQSLDLETEAGLLKFVARRLNQTPNQHRNGSRKGSAHKLDSSRNVNIAPGARLFGNIRLGRNVRIEEKVIILGPSIIADNVTIASASVVKSAVIGPGNSIPRNHFIQNRILLTSSLDRKRPAGRSKKRNQNINRPDIDLIRTDSYNDTFRIWSRFSYPRFFKRIADIIAALIVLVFFAPVFPLIALVIKLSSAGPILYGHKRQGLHGREFFCWKFRTMMSGADKMQTRLRKISQVDGPQFKMDDDPRVTAVGRFLRDTCIDELLQFFNVLRGDMSVVGPRPSPEDENLLCPPWRDARLSIRPGITGLWQVRRTRQEGQDFQEWVYYDIRYVKELSLKKDFWICWKTVVQLTQRFIRQF